MANMNSNMNATAIVDSVHDPKTGTWQYIVGDAETNNAIIIDPVLDFDPATQTINTTTADNLMSLIKTKGYKVQRILETHIHADHLTAAAYLQSTLQRTQGSKPSICIGKRIREAQRVFGQRYGVPEAELSSAFDCLLDDDETFSVGDLKVKVIHLPGHTADHVGYMVADNIFTGDSLFNPNLGTARCDFPSGSAQALYHSTRKLLSLPDHYKLYTGHDYPSAACAAPVPFTSVREQKQQNPYLQDDVSEQVFEAMRSERDAGLGEPRLLHASLQVNLRGGRLPAPAWEGRRFVRLPLKVGGGEW